MRVSKKLNLSYSKTRLFFSNPVSNNYWFFGFVLIKLELGARWIAKESEENRRKQKEVEG